jgi:hypothetical protein
MLRGGRDRLTKSLFIQVLRNRNGPCGRTSGAGPLFFAPLLRQKDTRRQLWKRILKSCISN